MTSIGLMLPALRRGAGPRRILAALAARWQRRQRLRATRRYVMEMDAPMLADIGVSRAQALFEIDRESMRNE
ncbi:MAG: DUF1127 domain-containing protein [Rhodospirillales bacterium]|nr:DUF1127 domain-containing protein [Rhodospirillales bacterium]